VPVESVAGARPKQRPTVIPHLEPELLDCAGNGRREGHGCPLPPLPLDSDYAVPLLELGLPRFEL
jgi:hypothetical protein